MSKPFIIGLTGNIATGKSTVMALLAERGALTIDADGLVHEILAADPEAQTRIVARFGPEIARPDGRIDRGRLGAIVFHDRQGLSDLEAIVHPRVGERVRMLIAQATAPVVVIEAIKLLEGQLRALCDSIWVSDCRPEQQVERLLSGRGLTRAQALARINSQAPQEHKVAQADVVIDTSGTLAETEQQVEAAWSALPAVQAERRTRPVIRRASARDVAALAAFLNARQAGSPSVERLELLASFGEQGYMLAEVDGEIQGVIAWNTEDFIARLRQPWLPDGPSLAETGRPLVESVCRAAIELMCEAALLFVPDTISEQEKSLYEACNFGPVEVSELIPAWRRAAESSMPAGCRVMLRKLRERRVMQPV